MGVFTIVTVLISVSVMWFLILQVQSNHTIQVENYVASQRMIEEAAKSVISSSTQLHPLYRAEEIFRARTLFATVIFQHGGNVAVVERKLGIPKNELIDLRDKIEERYEQTVEFLMERFIAVQPELNTELNERAKLKRRKPKHITN